MKSYDKIFKRINAVYDIQNGIAFKISDQISGVLQAQSDILQIYQKISPSLQETILQLKKTLLPIDHSIANSVQYSMEILSNYRPKIMLSVEEENIVIEDIEKIIPTIKNDIVNLNKNNALSNEISLTEKRVQFWIPVLLSVILAIPSFLDFFTKDDKSAEALVSIAETQIYIVDAENRKADALEKIACLTEQDLDNIDKFLDYLKKLQDEKTN